MSRVTVYVKSPSQHFIFYLFQVEKVKYNPLKQKDHLNETEICETLQAEIDQLVWERDVLASENIDLKAEIDHIYKMKAFNMVPDLMYFG